MKVTGDLWDKNFDNGYSRHLDLQFFTVKLV